MSILRIETPAWVRQEMEKSQIPQQRTILPQSYFTQGINSPQKPGMFKPKDAQRQLDDKMGQRQDAVPAMLRHGEEVIPPEVIAKMGGRENFLSAMNEKLGPTGIQLHGGKGPVTGGQPEEDALRGTVRPMDYQQQPQQGMDSMRAGAPGFARGTAGIRFNFAKGTPQVSTGMTQYPGGMLTNTRESPLGATEIDPRQRHASGTTGINPVPNQTVATPQVKQNTAAAPTPAVAAPQQSTISTTSTQAPVVNGPQAAAIKPSVQGIGFSPTDVTQTSLYKTQAKAADEAIQKTGAVGAMTNAQNLAQQGIGQDTSAGRTSVAQQQAGTESKIAATNTELAGSAQKQQAADLQTQMQLAYQSGDWGSVNKALAAMGQSPVDFTNLEQQRQAGNLSGAAQTLFNLANSITGTDAQSVATKSALSQEATGLLSTGLKTTLGAQYNPQALTDAVANVGKGDISDPATATFVNHIASAPLQWIQNSQTGKQFVQSLQNNPQGKSLLALAGGDNPEAISLLAEISTYACSNAYGIPLNDDQINLLKQYGAYTDFTKMSAADKAFQEVGISGATTSVVS
jgi:hypothetical protein